MEDVCLLASLGIIYLTKDSRKASRKVLRAIGDIVEIVLTVVHSGTSGEFSIARTAGIVIVVGWYGPSKMHFLKASSFGLVSMYLKKRDRHFNVMKSLRQNAVKNLKQNAVKNLRQNAVKSLRQNAVKSLRQNVVKSLRQNAMKNLRQNAVKKLRQNAVKKKILPEFLSTKTSMMVFKNRQNAETNRSLKRQISIDKMQCLDKSQ
ncbi:hypothetical protein Tco_0905386 [Tanacetum coccineum]